MTKVHCACLSCTFIMFNSSPPSAAYICQWIRSALVQIMVCRLFGTKPLDKPMLGYCQLDRQEQTSVKFESECYHFHSRKCIWKCRLPDWRPFCPGDESKSRISGSFHTTMWWEEILRVSFILKEIIRVSFIPKEIIQFLALRNKYQSIDCRVPCCSRDIRFITSLMDHIIVAWVSSVEGTGFHKTYPMF